MFTSLYAERTYGLWPSYNKGDFVEIYQNLTIPRGSVVDGYFSFNYYGDFMNRQEHLLIILGLHGI